MLKLEIAQLPHDQLPLQQGLSMGSDVVAQPVTPIILGVTDLDTVLRVRAGIMFQSVIAGCSCADDPTTTSENSEYCELLFEIDKISALTTVVLV